MRLLVDATMLDGRPSGAATRLAALGAALSEHAGLELIHATRPGLDPLPGLSCTPVAGLDTPRRRLGAGKRWSQLARELRADAVLLGALPIPRVSGVPVLLTVHDLRFLDPASSEGALRRWWGRRFLAGNLRRADALIAVSKHTAKRLAEVLADDGPPIHVVPNAGTPGMQQRVAPEEITAFRRRLDWNARYVLMLGPVSRHKNVRLGLAILAGVRAHPDATDLGLVLAGRVDPAAARAVLRMARSLGVEEAVRITAELPPEEAVRALCGADALLVLGRSEGFSIPVVDAQRLGTPVLAVDSGALPEVAAEGAWIESPEDGRGLAGALLSALEPGDLRDARLHRALTLSRRWSWERSAAELSALLGTLPRS